jgi:hypothetical protein
MKDDINELPGVIKHGPFNRRFAGEIPAPVARPGALGRVAGYICLLGPPAGG